MGGSGLYIDAICNGVDEIPNVNKEIREAINEEFDEKGLKIHKDLKDAWRFL